MQMSLGTREVYQLQSAAQFVSASQSLHSWWGRGIVYACPLASSAFREGPQGLGLQGGRCGWGLPPSIPLSLGASKK